VLIALVSFKNFGGDGGLTYNDAIPALMSKLLPSGVLGIAITGLFASFMAGVAANVSSLNTVVTYDLVQPYLARERSDRFYLNTGRLVTVGGVVIAIFTAILASHFNNIMTYLQSLFSIFNAPIFATFILGMFVHKTSAWGGFWGLLAGVSSGALTFLLFQTHVFTVDSAIYATFIQAGVAFVVDMVVSVAVTVATPKPDPENIKDLVWTRRKQRGATKPAKQREVWWRRPTLLGGVVLAAGFVLNIIFV